jgi:site-specific recombinase XerD
MIKKTPNQYSKKLESMSALYNKRFKKVFEALKMKPLTSHQSHHAFASLFMWNTGDVQTLSKLLVHSNLATTINFVKNLNYKTDDSVDDFYEKYNTN